MSKFNCFAAGKEKWSTNLSAKPQSGESHMTSLDDSKSGPALPGRQGEISCRKENLDLEEPNQEEVQHSTEDSSSAEGSTTRALQPTTAKDTKESDKTKIHQSISADSNPTATPNGFQDSGRGQLSLSPKCFMTPKSLPQIPQRPEACLVSSFSSARGSAIRISKKETDTSRKLFFEDDIVDDPFTGISKRKRNSCLDSHPFKAPKPKYPIPSDTKQTHSDDSAGRKKTDASLENSVHLNGDKDREPSQSFILANSVENRKVPISEVMNRRRSRSRRGWRPVSPFARHSLNCESSQFRLCSPFEKLRGFDAAVSMPPDEAYSYVFPNGVSSLSMYGAMIDQHMTPNSAWVRQHYQLIIWKLSAFQSNQTQTALTADNAFEELIFRYQLKQNEKRKLSILEYLLSEKDYKKSVTVVLLVLDAGTGDGLKQKKIVLTDYWRAINCKIDEGLVRRVTSGNIKNGSSILIESFEVENSEDLNGEGVQAILSSNRCIVVPSNTPIGRAKPSAEFLPLSQVDPDGGIVSSTVLCIYRKYPAMYPYKNPDGSLCLLTCRDHQRIVDEFNQRNEQAQSMANDLVRNEEARYFKRVHQESKDGKEVDHSELLYADHLLNGIKIAQLKQTDRHLLIKADHEKSLAECRSKQREKIVQDWGLRTPSKSIVLDLVATEVSFKSKPSDAQISLKVFLSEGSTGIDFREDDVFEFKKLSIERSTDGWSLIADSSSSFKKISTSRTLHPAYSAFFSPRCYIEDFSGVRLGSLVDFEVFVVSEVGRLKDRAACLVHDSTEFSKGTLLALIDPAGFDLLGTLKADQMWRFRDLRLSEYRSEDRIVLAQVTKRSSCMIVKQQVKLMKMRNLYRSNRTAVDERVRSSLHST